MFYISSSATSMSPLEIDGVSYKGMRNTSAQVADQLSQAPPPGHTPVNCNFSLTLSLFSHPVPLLGVTSRCSLYS